MLLAGPNTAAPTVRYPLDVQGWHAVSIGVLPSRPGESDGHAVRVRLSDDAVETMLHSSAEASHGVHDRSIVEMFWKVADLTDQDLHIGQVAWQEAPGDGIGAVRCMHARIAYIKVVPLTEAEAEATRADRAEARNRTLFAHQDAHGPHWLWRMTTADEVRRELEPYRDTDFSRMYWECGQGDLMYNLTNIGRRCTFDGLDDFDRVGDRLHAESWRAFAAQGIDPLRVALDYCHEIGMEFHASWRVAGFHFPPPHDHFDHGDGIYKRHPEWRGEDRNGVRTPRMAYSFPEVRAHAVDLLREVAQHPIDGVCLLYNRRPPLVEYERPIVEGFTRTHGGFPRLLPPDDPTWLKYRAQTLTQFMREVREAMDEEAEKQGRSSRIQVSAIVGATEQENLQIAMDPARLGCRGPGRHADSILVGAGDGQLTGGVDGSGSRQVAAGPDRGHALHGCAEHHAAAFVAGGVSPSRRRSLWGRCAAPVLLGLRRSRGPRQLPGHVDGVAAAGASRGDCRLASGR